MCLCTCNSPTMRRECALARGTQSFLLGDATVMRLSTMHADMLLALYSLPSSPRSLKMRQARQAEGADSFENLLPSWVMHGTVPWARA